MELSVSVLVRMSGLHVHNVVERDVDLIVRMRLLRAERISGEGGVTTRWWLRILCHRCDLGRARLCNDLLLLLGAVLKGSLSASMRGFS